jgi:hypothetical protein
MKTLTVKKLIELLKTVDQDSALVVEGCDCAEDCVGISLGEAPYETQVILRRDRGAFDLDDLKIITNVGKKL